MSPRRGVVLRILRGVRLAVIAIGLFLVAVMLGVLVHVNTPRARRFVLGKANGLLEGSFDGRIAVQRIGRIGLFGVSDLDATIDGPTGARVLSVRGLRVDIRTLAAARARFFEPKAPLTVRVSRLSIDSLDLSLDADDRGRLELSNAVAPRMQASSRSTRAVRLVVPRIALRHASTHRREAHGQPPIDVDVDDVLGTLAYGPEALDVDVSNAKITARRFAGGADVIGSLEAHVRKPNDAAMRPEARLAWSGSVGGIAHSVRASFANDTLHAVADFPEASPEKVRAVLPAWPVNRPIRAHLEARGPLRDVGFDFRAGFSGASFDQNIAMATIDATGRVVLGGDIKARFAVEMRDVDPHDFLGVAPHFRAGAAGEVSAERKAGGALSGEVALRVAPLGPSMGGSGKLFADGALDPARRTFVAHLRAEAEGIAGGTVRVQSASIEANAHGPLGAPELEAGAHLGEVRAAALHLTSVELTTRGNATAPHVTVSARGPDTPDIDAEADVALRRGIVLQRPRVVLARAGVRSVVIARELTFRGGEVALEDARVDGLGEPLTATLHVTAPTTSLHASSRGLDLGRIGRLANVEKYLRSGTLAMDSNFVLHAGAGDGRATLDVADVEVGKAKALSAHADMSLEGRRLAAVFHASVPGAGTIVLDVAMQGDVDGQTGSLRLQTQARDAKGPLAALDATANDFPYADLIKGFGHLAADLGKARIDARLTLPERGLSTMPPPLRQRYVTGKLKATVAIAGTLQAPTMDVAATLSKARFGGSGATKPLEVDLSARYDGREGNGRLKAHSANADHDLLDVQTQIHAAGAQLFMAGGSPLRWTASGRAHMASFPLEAIGEFDDKRVSGSVSGDISFDDLHEDARADARLTVDGLSVGGVQVGSSRVDLQACKLEYSIVSPK